MKELKLNQTDYETIEASFFIGYSEEDIKRFEKCGHPVPTIKHEYVNDYIKIPIKAVDLIENPLIIRVPNIFHQTERNFENIRDSIYGLCINKNNITLHSNLDVKIGVWHIDIKYKRIK